MSIFFATLFVFVVIPFYEWLRPHLLANERRAALWELGQLRRRRRRAGTSSERDAWDFQIRLWKNRVRQRHGEDFARKGDD